jgi:hypothetical protein
MQMALIGECFVNQYSTSEAANLHHVAKCNSVNIESIREAAEAKFAPKGKAANNSKTVSTPPIAAQAQELNAEKMQESGAEVTAPAEAKKLPPGMQKAKEKYEAKAAKKALKASKDVSANADALEVPADKAAGTETEVANA